MALVVATMVSTTAAVAATPQDIAEDLKDGKLDGTYTQAEWEAFFKNATVQGYANVIVNLPQPQPTQQPLPEQAQQPAAQEQQPAAQQPAAQQPPAAEQPGGVAPAEEQQAAQEQPSGVLGVQAAAPAPEEQGVLPFTGVDLALLAAGGLGLIALGVGMRRFARDRD